MRKIIVSMVVSLDGLIEDSNKKLTWHLWDEEIENYMVNFFTKVDTIIVGRLAYEQMAAYWPAADTENTAIKYSMNTLRKIVYSRTLKYSDWNNTEIKNEIVTEEVNELKNEDGKDIVIFGGAEICSAFINRGLADEYQLFIMPVVLGRGTPLFKDINHKINPVLLKVKQFKIGAAVLHYKTNVK
jgi:dihydrofolate reductase